MSEKKTIQFNPDLFKFSTNKTRKTRTPTSNSLKIKTQSSKSNLDTIKKRSILKMIRQHQESSYNKLLSNDKKPDKNKDNMVDYQQQFVSNFENSKQFLNKLVEDNDKKNQNDILNRTLKKYPTATNSLLYSNLSENSNVNPNNNNNTIIPSLNGSLQTSVINNLSNSINSLSNKSTPSYGCLKGGSLPTYRHWLNRTQKSMNSPTINVNTNTNSFVNNSNNTLDQSIIGNIPSLNRPKNEAEVIEQKINEHIKQVSGMKQTMEKLQNIKNANKFKRMKQKKTIRRTYKLGKSKLIPRISVLVSNRTIRNNITTKTHLLKQVPIQEIKQFLIKRGLIKVGTIAPNDILRKMYESALLICGEVQNHNPENLLYNFINNNDK